jgi:hypothetical protein
MSDSTRQSVLFEHTFRKPVQVEFDAESQTSDGGLLLLAAADERLGLTESLARRIEDPRQPGKVGHSMLDLVRQRVFAIAQGYEDGTEAARLADDPGLRFACERSIGGEDALASQSTLSRFENLITARDTVHMLRHLEETAVGELKRRYRRPGRIVIDLDPSVDPTHGDQQGTLFNGYYDTWCYLPLFGFLSIDGGDGDHLLFCGRLRPGTSKELRGTIPLLRRMVARLREVYGPKQSILVRLDSGFSYPLLFDVLEDLRVQYVVGMPSNKKLAKWAESRGRLPTARAQARRSGQAERVYDERFYQTRSWPRPRRVLLKAEVLPYRGRALKNNPRYVVTNLRHKPENVFALYYRRGDVENRIKELKCDLSIDRTSCSRFVANQFRVTLTATAYLLFQELRWRLRRTRYGRAQVGRLRTALLKVSARVVESVRRIVFHLPMSYAFTDDFARAAIALGARRRQPAT